jgi:hypothetical protein
LKSLSKIKKEEKKGEKEDFVVTYRILFRTSSGSGVGLRMRHIATQPATIIDVIIMPAASTKAASIII